MIRLTTITFNYGEVDLEAYSPLPPAPLPGVVNHEWESVGFTSISSPWGEIKLIFAWRLVELKNALP